MLKSVSRDLSWAGVLVLGVVLTGSARADSVAIVTGSFYTSNLKNDLTAAGHTVTEITTYTAASLAAFNAVVVYGNETFLDQNALDAYVIGGGTLVETPWFWRNYTPISDLQVFSNGGGVDFVVNNPGITVLAPGDRLLTGVSFPVGPGGFNIGRTSGNTFIAGVTQVANWSDGTAMIGYKSLGSGRVIGINLHVITSDCAYYVIDQPWATRLFGNAVGGTPFSSFSASPMIINPYSFSLNASFALPAGGPAFNPNTQTLALRVGSSLVVIPAGSFHGSYGYSFSGILGGEWVTASISPAGGTSYLFSIKGGSPSPVTAPGTNPVAVTLVIDSYTGTTSDTWYY